MTFCPPGGVSWKNFRAGPFSVRLERSNRNDFVCLLPWKVNPTVMLRILKFWKETPPERAEKKDKTNSFTASGKLSWLLTDDALL